MLKSVKVKLCPTLEQQEYLAKLFGCNRKVYNLCLAKKKEMYDNEKINFGLKELGKYFHQELVKTDELNYLKEHNTKVLKQSIRTLLTAYKNFFDSVTGKRKGEKVGFPKFKSKYDNQSVLFPIDAISKKAITGDNNNRLNLVKQINNLKFRCSKADKKYLLKYIENIRSITIKKSKAGTYTASILIDGSPVNEFRKNIPLPVEYRNKAIGIDLGIKTYITAFDGKDSYQLDNPKFFTKKEKQLKHLQRKLSALDEKNRKKRNEEFKEKNGRDIDEKTGRKAVDTANRRKLKKQIAKVYEEIVNARHTFINEATSMLVKNNQIICMEDLNVKGMMKNHKLAKPIQDLCLGEFRSNLEGKAKMYDSVILKVGRFYASSKTCSCCGHIKKDLKLSDRIYICEECGLVIDRDENASINIYHEGLRIKEEKEKIGNRYPELKPADCPLLDDPFTLTGELLKRYDRQTNPEMDEKQEDAVEFNRFHRSHNGIGLLGN